MNCKNCGTELEEGAIVCTSCGEMQPEAPKPKKKNWIPIVAVICCVALIAGIVAVFIGMNAFPDTQTEAITIKSVYTASDETVKAQHDVVVAKAGNFELTNGELQVLYWSMVYDFLDYYGDYAYYYIDFSLPLSGQYCNEEAGLTWEHYFLDMALQTWYRYEVLTENAEKAGVELNEVLRNQLNNLRDTMESNLESAGFETVEDMVHHDFGNAATFDDYMAYMDIYYHGNNYYNLLYTEIQPTDAEIEAYYTENEAALVEAGYGKESGSLMDVRHILIEPVDEDWETCLETAQNLMDQWQDLGGDEVTFAALAKEHSTCSSASDGGLLSGFAQGAMVEPFDTWCFGQEHEYGDYGLVQTEFGWHIIFYVDSYELWREVVVSNLASEIMFETMADMEDDYTVVVAFSRIVLADVPLS